MSESVTENGVVNESAVEVSVSGSVVAGVYVVT